MSNLDRDKKDKIVEEKNSSIIEDREKASLFPTIPEYLGYILTGLIIWLAYIGVNASFRYFDQIGVKGAAIVEEVTSSTKSFFNTKINFISKSSIKRSEVSKENLESEQKQVKESPQKKKENPFLSGGTKVKDLLSKRKSNPTRF